MEMPSPEDDAAHYCACRLSRSAMGKAAEDYVSHHDLGARWVTLTKHTAILNLGLKLQNI